MRMDTAGPARILQIVVLGAVALTAAAGGATLAAAALIDAGPPLTPSTRYLAGTPFDSYLVPGLLLLLVVGGLHALAFGAELRRSRRAPIAVAVAAFGLLIWIFVQMVVIPFSPLQAVYEAAAIVELGLLLAERGVLDDVLSRRPADTDGLRTHHQPAA